MPEFLKPRLLMVDTEFGFKDLWNDLYKAFKWHFDVVMVGYNDDVKKIEKFDPDYVFYFQSLRANMHLRTVNKKRYLRTVCWIVDDPVRYDENIDCGVLYDFVLTVDYGGYKARKDIGHRNVYYMPPCVNTTFFYPNHKKPDDHVLFITRGNRLNKLTMEASKSDLKYEMVNADVVPRFDLAEIINSANFVVEADQREDIINANKVKAETHFSGLDTIACKKSFLFDSKFNPETLGLKFRDDYIVAAYSKFDEVMHIIKQYMGTDEAKRLADNAYNTLIRKHTVEVRAEEIKTLITRKC